MSTLPAELPFAALYGFSTASEGLSPAWATVVAAVFAAGGVALGAIHANRAKGPSAMEAYNGLIQQLQDRVAVLERHSRQLEGRVLHLERENAVYKQLYGPLPGEKESPE